MEWHESIDTLTDRPRFWHNQSLRNFAAVSEGWRTYDDVYRRTEWDSERLQALVDRQLRDILSAVAQHGTAEQRAVLSEADMRRAPHSTLNLLPPLRKSDLIERPHELRTGLVQQVDVLRARTSGTTGEPVAVEHGESHLVHGFAASMRAFHAYGLSPGFRTLRITCDPRHELVHFGADATTWTRLRINLSKIDSGNAGYIERLVADFRPDVLWGQPMELLVLAGRVRSGELEISTPELVFTHGDTIDAQTRRAFAVAFDAPHRDVFGLQEFGQVAWECPVEPQTYHVNEERVHIGTDGDGALLLTNLVNRAMLLVRYRPEDRAELIDGACRCGRALRRLRGLEGRQRGFIADRDRVPVNVKPVQLYLESLPLLRWQVRQTEPGSIEVLVVPRDSTCDVNRNHIAASMNLADVKVREVELEELLTRSGKSIRFDLCINQQNLARQLTGPADE